MWDPLFDGVPEMIVLGFVAIAEVVFRSIVLPTWTARRATACGKDGGANAITQAAIYICSWVLIVVALFVPVVGVFAIPIIWSVGLAGQVAFHRRLPATHGHGSVGVVVAGLSVAITIDVLLFFLGARSTVAIGGLVEIVVVIAALLYCDFRTARRSTKS